MPSRFQISGIFKPMEFKVNNFYSNNKYPHVQTETQHQTEEKLVVQSKIKPTSNARNQEKQKEVIQPIPDP